MRTSYRLLGYQHDAQASEYGLGIHSLARRAGNLFLNVFLVLSISSRSSVPSVFEQKIAKAAKKWRGVPVAAKSVGRLILPNSFDGGFQVLSDVGMVRDDVLGFGKVINEVEQLVRSLEGFSFGLLTASGAVAQNQFPVSHSAGKHAAAGMVDDDRALGISLLTFEVRQEAEAVGSGVCWFGFCKDIGQRCKDVGQADCRGGATALLDFAWPADEERDSVAGFPDVGFGAS